MKATSLRIWSLLAAAIVISVSVATNAGADDAKALVRKAIEALPRSTFAAKLKLRTGRQEPQQLTLRHKMIEGVRASYMEVTSPADVAGVRFLFLESLDKPPVQYLRVPTSPRHLLVADDVRMRPFLNSAFYVADFVEPALDDFNFAIVGEEEILGRKCKMVEAVPKDPSKAVYGKTIVGIDPKDSLILKRDFYDHDGKLFKQWTADAVEKISGHWTQLKQTMSNIEDGIESRLEIVEIKYDVDLDDSMFKPDYLLQ